MRETTPETGHRANTREPETLPDLFGSAVPASVTTAKKRPARAAAEWPAAGSAPVARVDARGPRPAGDRSLAPASASLSGTYARTGATLRRSDGIALVVCQSEKPALGPRDSARYVRVGRPGGGKPDYAGNLYRPASGGADDLDKHEFQDVATGVRYGLSLTAPGTYAVSPVRRRRKRSGA